MKRTINELSSTPHGRLYSAAVAVALVGGGLSAILHGGPVGITIFTVSLMASILLTTISIAMSINRHPAFGIMTAIASAYLFVLYVVGVQLVSENNAGWGWVAYAFFGLGAIVGLVALRGKPVTGTLHPHGHHAHAHAH